MTLGRYAIAHVDGKAVMVSGAAPGDLLDVAIMSERRDYAIARIVKVVRPGAGRRVAPCPYAAECGGCDWQQIDYATQLATKGELVAADFRRALRIELDQHGLVEPSPHEFGYRSRVRLRVGPDRRVGFSRPASNSLIEIDRCMVSAVELEGAAELARTLGRACREIELVEGENGTVLVADLTMKPGAAELRRAAGIIKGNGRIAGLILRAGAAREVVGRAGIAIEIEPDCILEADADLFSQVNRTQNLKLVAAVMKLAGVSSAMRLLDLYCGAGNFTLPAARRGAVVTGVDANPRAIEAARVNAARMNLTDAQFISMPAAETARFLAHARYRPDVVTLDPPRSGAADLMEPVAALKPLKVIYVSCDPATMVRDLRILTRKGYEIGEVRAFDFFPNTHHLEVVASALLT